MHHFPSLLFFSNFPNVYTFAVTCPCLCHISDVSLGENEDDEEVTSDGVITEDGRYRDKDK